MQPWKITDCFKSLKGNSVFRMQWRPLFQSSVCCIRLMKTRKNSWIRPQAMLFFYALFCCSFHYLTQRLSSVLHHAILEGQGKNSIWYLTVQVPLRECSKWEKSVYRTFSTKPDVVHTIPVVCSLHTVESGHCGYTLTLLLKSVEKKIDLDFSVSTGVHIPDVWRNLPEPFTPLLLKLYSDLHVGRISQEDTFATAINEESY